MTKNNKKFGLLSIILLSVNSIVGSGIFLMPGKAYALSGNASILAYVFAMLLAGSIALCFAEASGIFDSNGSAYVYAKEAFGDFIGFEVGVTKYLIQIVAWCAMACAFATALGSVIPEVQTSFWFAVTVSVIIVGLTLINLLGVDVIRKVNNISAIAKLTPLLLIIVLGFFFVDPANIKHISLSSITPANFSQTVILVFYGFTGFEGIATAAEDMDDPKHNLPIAIVCTMLIISIMYILIQIVCIGLLGSKLGDMSAPLVEACGYMIGGAGSILVSMGTLISILGINIAASFSTPRTAEALSHQNMLPSYLEKTNSHGVPYRAVILTGMIALPIALSGNFVFLATIGVIARFAQYIPTVLGVMMFRKKGYVSTFRIPFGNLIPLIALAATIWLFFNVEFYKLVIGFGAMVVIIPLYFVMKRHNEKIGVNFN